MLPLFLLVVVYGCATPAEPPAPAADSSAPRTELDPASSLGDPGRTLLWTAEQQIPSYRNYDRIYPTRTIAAGTEPLALPENLVDLTGVRYDVEGESFDIDGFFEHNRVVGLLVLKHGEIAFERYAHGNDRSTRWVSYSVAKSVVSMLVGAAVQDGYIESLDEPVTTYLPRLRGSSYDGVSLRHALWMSSGVEWNEDYADPESDVGRSRGGTLERMRYLGSKPRVAPAGEVFNYNTGETHLVGAVVRSAIGNNLATYLSAKIWRPFGMEADANWMLIEPDGGEHGGCCISATLRDYGRIGLFALHDGVLADGTRVLPEGWMAESTTPSPGSDRYGFLWWLRGEGRYSAIGIFGQTIAIDPGEDLVIVTHSAWPKATGREFSGHTAALVTAITAALSND